MNKILIVTYSLLIFSCATVPSYYSFDEALEIGLHKIENELSKGTQVAILDFKSDNENLSLYIIEEIYDKLINLGNLVIMERSRINTIAIEVGYQYSGFVDDNEIRRIGIQLGADYVVTGEIIFSGEAYRLRVFAIDIEKGRRVASSSLNINRNDRQINHLLTIRQSTPNNISQPLVEKIYEIGDIGPAGGIIFYDKGFISERWRYLEASPVDLQKAKWGFFGIGIGGTEKRIGSGKRNTEIIMGALNQWGENEIAAQFCRLFTLNGYSDWFMPSNDELIEIYENLKLNGLGNFGDELYWSSSQNDANSAWGQFFNGYQDYHAIDKNGIGSVRAIRAF